MCMLNEKIFVLLQRNIPKNQFGTHLDSAKKYLSILKTVEWCGFAACEAQKLA